MKKNLRLLMVQKVQCPFPKTEKVNYEIPTQSRKKKKEKKEQGGAVGGGGGRLEADDQSK